MSKKNYFISTNLEFNIDKKNKQILAGGWCINNHKKDNLQKHDVLENFWRNKKKYNSYYKYLQKLSLIYSKRLSFYLNSFHKKKLSVNFWKIILMPWLTIYLPVYYYRWLAVKKILKRKDTINFYDLYNLKKNNIYADTFDFHTKTASNKYINYNIFYSLMKHHQVKNNRIIFHKKKLLNYDKKINLRENKLFYYLFSFYNKILNRILYFFYHRNKIFIEKAVFPIRNNIEMNLKLNQIPTYPNDTFNNSFGYTGLYKYNKINLVKRRSFNLGKKVKTDTFIKYIDSVIRDDIPKCFVEGFDNLCNFSEKIKFKPKIILSSYYHYFNELFKVWTAYLVERKKTKLFIVSHGGGSYLKNPSCLNFETEVADIKINWHRSKKKKEIQLPASKFFNFRKTKSLKKNSICYVEGPVSPYPSRIGDQIIDNGSPMLNSEFLKFFKKIYKPLKKQFIFIPSSNYGVDTTINLKNDLKLRQIKENKSFKKYKHTSRLNILNYPQTAFFESLMIAPTILLYKKNDWVFDKEFLNFYKKFVKHKIIFHDPIKAAKHVNFISNDINGWWNSKVIQSIIKDFLDHTCVVSNFSLEIWSNSLKTQFSKVND